jgi:energy-converting hydrogenase Eha subunit C
MGTATPAGVGLSWSKIQDTLRGDRGSANAAPPGLQYESSDGCHLAFRAGVVKLVAMKLAGIGIVVALIAAAGLSVKATRSCALSAGICLIASLFYMRIWQIRRQGWTGGPYYDAEFRQSKAMEKQSQPSPQLPQEEAKEPTVTVLQRLFVQENAVDSLRRLDWSITLVLMAIETDTIINQLAPTRAAPIGPFVSALMQSSLVQIGTVGRSYFNNGRTSKSDAGVGVAVTVVCFLVASAMWVATTWSVLEHIGPLTAETYPDAADLSEAAILYVLAIVQVVYPLTAVLDFLWMHWVPKRKGEFYLHNEYSPNLSTLRDLLYGFSDIVTKGGLALVSFQLATRS